MTGELLRWERRNVTDRRWEYVVHHADLRTSVSTVQVVDPEGNVLHEQGSPNMTGAGLSFRFESDRPDLQVQIASE